MSPSEERPFTLPELAELTRREQAARGQTRDMLDREFRARLERLRASQGPEPVQPADPPASPGLGLEARVTALEEEVKRLRDRVERENG